MAEAKKTALVTGANRGIGLEVCRQLAQAGMRVLLGARDVAKGESAAKSLALEGLEVRAVRLDVTSPDSVMALARDHAPCVDVLVNNAGVDYDTHQTALTADLIRVRQTFETNLFGTWAAAQAFAPGMHARGWGRIVNVSSGAGSLADMGHGPPGYISSKAALNALTRLLAAELAGTGVLVNSVCPSWVATDMGGSGGRPLRDGAASVVWAVVLPMTGQAVVSFVTEGRSRGDATLPARTGRKRARPPSVDLTHEAAADSMRVVGVPPIDARSVHPDPAKPIYYSRV